MDRKERDKKIAELKQILADIKKLPWKTAPEELNNLKEYKKVLKSHGDVANKKQLHKINSSIKKYHNKLMSRKGGAKGVGSVKRGKELLERKPGVGKLRKHNKEKIQLSAARQAQIEKDFTEAAKHAGVKNFGDILITSGFRSYQELKDILDGRMKRFAPLFKKYPNLKDPITDILVGIPNWKEVSKEIEKPNGKWYIRPTGTKLPPLKWENRVDAQKGLKKVIDKEISKKYGGYGQSPMGQNQMKKELLKANNLGLAQLNRTRDDFMGARSDHLHGKKFDIYQALFAHPKGWKMAQYLQDKKNYSFFQEYFPKTGSNVWDMRVPDPGEKSRSNFDFEAAFHKDVRPEKSKHDSAKSLPILQRKKRDQYYEDQKGVLKGKHRKPWHKILAHEGEGERTLHPVAAQYQAEHKKRKPKKKSLTTKNKALAEARIRINELKTADAKDPKVRAAKAIAYDDYIRAGGKEDQFSDWWRRYLPRGYKGPSFTEKSFKEFKETDPSQTEGYTGIDDPSIMVEEKTEGYTGPDDKSVMKDFKNFPTGEEGGDPKIKTPAGTVGETELHPAMEAQKRRQLAMEGQPGIPLGKKPAEVEEEEDFTFKGDDPRERIEEQIKLREKLYEPPSGLSPAQTAANPTAEAKGMPQDMLVDYKIRQNTKGFNEGGSVLKEPELSEDEEIAARQTGDTDIVSEALEDKVTGTVPTPVDSWRLKPKTPKPPREPILTEEGVVMVKQQETGNTDKMSKEEIKKKIDETKEIVSEDGSDTVTLQTRPSQIKRNKELNQALHQKQMAEDPRFGSEEEFEAYKKVGDAPQPQLGEDRPQLGEEKLTEKITVKETADPQAFDLITHIQQLTQRNDEARDIMRKELDKANEAELNIQKVEPFRFWNTMSTPAKIVAGIGMLIGGYAAKDSPAGLQAVMNVIDGAVNADIQAQKLTQDQQLVVAKEATRRAKAAVDKYKAVAINPVQQAKLMELAQALETKKAGIAQKQQLQALRTYVMNQARSGRLHLVPPSLMRMVYPKEDMKRIDTMRTNYEKERKDRKIQPVLSAYRRMHNLISRKEEITGMDDIAVVFSFMKLLDPGSVVRESEFETAANAGPRAKWFARQWNRFITGGRFTESDRKGFLRSALTLVKPALDEDKELQRKYVAMSRRYGYPAAFVIPPSTRYFDLPGTKDDAAIRKIMKEQGKTREEAEDIHHYVVHGVKSKKQKQKEKIKKTYFPTGV